MLLSGVGEASAHALADAGYGTIGDIIADSAEEVAQKADISLGVARTVQIAADRYLQESQLENKEWVKNIIFVNELIESFALC